MTPRAVILDVFVRGLYPLMLAASVWILLRGHNEPGGGFIGGMVAVAATAMLAVARGSEFAQGRMPLGPLRLAAAGVLLGLLAGLPAWWQGEAYMTHQWGTLPLGFTDFKVSTVLLFDIGVFAAVWGALGGLCAQMVSLDEPEPEPDLTGGGVREGQRP
jgi:multicomponent Na+:H+ antiporter subunit B